MSFTGDPLFSELIQAVHWSPVFPLPFNTSVIDFSEGQKEPNRGLVDTTYSIGRYNEVRTGLYKDLDHFKDRVVHMGLDLGAPAQTEIKNFYEGHIYQVFNDQATGGFGPTIITKHHIQQMIFFALYGHLSSESLDGWLPGQAIRTGQVIGTVGARETNGGWNPHLHFQLSLRDPASHEIQGVVSLAEREESLSIYPDPTFIISKSINLSKTI